MPLRMILSLGDRTENVNMHGSMAGACVKRGRQEAKGTKEATEDL